MGSFFAGCVGTLVLAAFAPPLTEVAFKFGPAEYFSLMVLGLIGAVVLASGSLLKAVGMIVLGLLLGLVGTDVNSGVARFSFDIPELTDGIGFVDHRHGRVRLRRDHRQPVASREKREVFTAKVQGLFPTSAGLQAHVPGRAARHCCWGSALGILPWRRRAAVGFRGLHDREEDQAAPGEVPFGQGQHPRRGGA
jgi:putative tricarboxylic transport membrane protein